MTAKIVSLPYPTAAKMTPKTAKPPLILILFQRVQPVTVESKMVTKMKITSKSPQIIITLRFNGFFIYILFFI